jgi:hypothetical protein
MGGMVGMNGMTGMNGGIGVNGAGAGIYMGNPGTGLGGMSVVQGTRSSVGAPDMHVSSNRHMFYHVKY